jgi:arsenite-transporting ATPase
MLNLARHAETGGYDAIVVDGLPLEEFLDLPPCFDAAARWLDRLFAPRQSNVFEPFVRMFAADYASAGEDLLESGRELLGRLADLRELLTDAEVSSVRVLLRTNDTAPADAREALTALSLFSYATDGLVFNRLLPDEVTDEFFAGTRSEQEDALAGAARAGNGMPVLKVYLTAEAPRGLETLGRLGAELYADAAAGDVLHRTVSPPSHNKTAATS